MGQPLDKIDCYFKAVNKAKRQFENEYPSIQTRLDKREDNLHLNIIDRTIFLIRLREFYHQYFIDILGADSQGEINQFEPSEALFKSKQEYFITDYIRHLDKELICEIGESLRRIQYLYLIGDNVIIKNRPFPSLLNDPNKLIISLFIFPIKKWLDIIFLEIEKLYGKKNTKKYLTHSDDILHLRYLLRTLPREIEDRIGTSEFKIYVGFSGYAYQNVTSLHLGLILEKLNINKILGNQNVEDKPLQIKTLEQHREALSFDYPYNKLYSIFKIFFSDYLGLKEAEFKNSLRLFLRKHSISHMELEKDWQELSDLKLQYIDDDNLKELYGFLLFLQDKNVAKFNRNKFSDIVRELTAGKFKTGKYRNYFTYFKKKDNQAIWKEYEKILRIQK